jgi:hypothetical protein
MSEEESAPSLDYLYRQLVRPNSPAVFAGVNAIAFESFCCGGQKRDDGHRASREILTISAK